MLAAVTVLWWLNLVDGLATYYFVAIRNCEGMEANPMMAWCIAHGWSVFFLVKLSCMTVAAVGLFVMRHTRPTWITRVLVGFCILIYAGVCCWHAYGFYLVATGAL